MSRIYEIFGTNAHAMTRALMAVSYTHLTLPTIA